MFITAAYAADATGGAAEALTSLLPPMIAVLAIMYFIGIRPQQKRQKEMRDMMAALRRGDTVATAGGLIGKIIRVLNDTEILVELAEGVRVRMLKAAVTEVRTKGEPVKEVAEAEEQEAVETAEAPQPSAAEPGESNVKPLPTPVNKAPLRQPYQKSKGRRR